MSNKKKLIVIVGPTASGKSSLAIKLAKKYNGEIISADSRQVYKGLKIGSGVVTKKEMAGIPHHLIGIANPKRVFTVSDYKKLARKELDKIWKRSKLPIIVGGTGLYIRAAVDGLVIPEVKPNPKLRENLEKKTTVRLSQMLEKIDLRRWKDIDKNNPRRLIRAIEIATVLGKVPKQKMNPIKADILFLGIKKDRDILELAIRKRVGKMIKNGLIAETAKLRRDGVSDKRIGEFGFEYSSAFDLINGKIISKSELLNRMTKFTLDYAKRQMTWFRRDNRIIWVRNKQEAMRKMKEFMK